MWRGGSGDDRELPQVLVRHGAHRQRRLPHRVDGPRTGPGQPSHLSSVRIRAIRPCHPSASLIEWMALAQVRVNRPSGSPVRPGHPSVRVTHPSHLSESPVRVNPSESSVRVIRPCHPFDSIRPSHPSVSFVRLPHRVDAPRAGPRRPPVRASVRVTRPSHPIRPSQSVRVIRPSHPSVSFVRALPPSSSG